MICINSATKHYNISSHAWDGSCKIGWFEEVSNSEDLFSVSKPGSSVSVVSNNGLDDQDVIPDKGRGFFI
jgi:hypothetical protein